MIELAIVVSAVVAAVGAAGVAVWTWRLGQLRAAATPRAGADAGASADAAPRVSIIVPARDEADNLPALLASLRRLDPPAHEVIVVDDGSTDATAAIARAAGATVIATTPLPAGWTGKPWACHAGAAAATGDLLLFTDADTAHAPWSLAAAVAELRAQDAGLLSVVPTHRSPSWWERMQGAFQLLLLIATRAGARGVRGSRRFSIGQYLLFRRDVYDRIGGHASVRGRLAEDLALARRVDDAGLGYAVAHAPGLVEVRMYPEGPRAFWRGWRRSFRDGLTSAGGGGTLEVVAVIGWLLGVPLAAAVAVAAGAPALAATWAALGLLTAAEVARRQRAVGPLPAWGALAFPVAALVFVAVSAAAALDAARAACRSSGAAARSTRSDPCAPRSRPCSPSRSPRRCSAAAAPPRPRRPPRPARAATRPRRSSTIRASRC
ncbi:MAG: glycosyltransferase [Kofleriaceae bacterium]|nr:glycosyltransferase [Kofleriaceae bacterium]